MKPTIYNKISIYLLAFGILFGLSTTIYFGGNYTPQSKAEWICDGITVVFLILGSLLHRRSKIY